MIPADFGFVAVFFALYFASPPPSGLCWWLGVNVPYSARAGYACWYTVVEAGVAVTVAGQCTSNREGRGGLSQG